MQPELTMFKKLPTADPEEKSDEELGPIKDNDDNAESPAAPVYVRVGACLMYAACSITLNFVTKVCPQLNICTDAMFISNCLLCVYLYTCVLWVYYVNTTIHGLEHDSRCLAWWNLKVIILCSAHNCLYLC